MSNRHRLHRAGICVAACLLQAAVAAVQAVGHAVSHRSVDAGWAWLRVQTLAGAAAFLAVAAVMILARRTVLRGAIGWAVLAPVIEGLLVTAAWATRQSGWQDTGLPGRVIAAAVLAVNIVGAWSRLDLIRKTVTPGHRNLA